MGYDAKWDSTDQIPQRAVNDGEIGRFGNIDPTDGGKTHRYSLSTEWEHNWTKSVTRASAYVMDYKLNLWSNFTYFLDDPENGDQFEQADDRTVFGGKISHRFLNRWGNFDAENVVGLQFRKDDINEVGLFHTVARQRLSTTRQDDVIETGTSVFFQNNMQWTEKIRTLVGIRGDFYRFKVDSNIVINSGTETKSLASPKFGVVVGPWKQNEFYFNYGYGYHSNDARGTTITVDPVTGEPAERVDPLVRAKGAEFGIRTAALKNLQSTVAIWRLDIDSELLFVGDAGITEPSRPSRRTGIEWSNYFRATPWLVLDADFAWSKARFRDFDPTGDRIPGAIEGVVSAGATFDNLSNFFGTLRWRYWGPRPLIEDNSVRSKSSNLFNARIGYKLPRQMNVYLDVFNIFNTDASDVDYFYASRLPGEPEDGIDDIHFHPSESRSFRISFSAGF
jgi:outer membrane receptor protein involved in Fe transport